MLYGSSPRRAARCKALKPLGQVTSKPFHESLRGKFCYHRKLPVSREATKYHNFVAWFPSIRWFVIQTWHNFCCFFVTSTWLSHFFPTSLLYHLTRLLQLWPCRPTLSGKLWGHCSVHSQKGVRNSETLMSCPIRCSRYQHDYFNFYQLIISIKTHREHLEQKHT